MTITKWLAACLRRLLCGNEPKLCLDSAGLHSGFVRHRNTLNIHFMVLFWNIDFCMEDKTKLNKISHRIVFKEKIAPFILDKAQ